MLYRILLFSVKLQHESAIGKHISPPFWTSLPSPSPSHPSRLIQSLCLSFLSYTGNSHWLFSYGNISFHVTLCIHLTLSSPLLMSISLFSMAQETQTGALYQPRGVGWGGRWERGSKRRGYMYTYGWFMLKFDRKQ